ncbi:MAG TPA: aquaporin [Candidatus Limnocylindrales bacterium]
MGKRGAADGDAAKRSAAKPGATKLAPHRGVATATKAGREGLPPRTAAARSSAPRTGRSRSDERGRAGDQAEEGGLGAMARRGLSECVGAFALTLVAAGAEVISAVAPGQLDHVSRAVAPGLLVMAFIYALGDASGAHFNPVVTLAFTVRRAFPPAWVPLYWGAQLAGAVGAALFLRLVLGDVGGLGTTVPKLGLGPALAFEIVLTWLLVTVVLGTADRYRLVGPNAALAVGATIALCGLFAGPVSDASMNPARSLGPALVSGRLGDVWVYLIGPATGALLAAGTTFLLHGRHDGDGQTEEAAMGEPDRRAAA